MFAFDTETTLITEDEPVPRLVCLTVANGDGEPEIFHVTDPECRAVVDALLGSSEILATANGSFDFAVLCRQWPDLRKAVFRAYDAGRVSDVQIRQKLLDIAAGKYRIAGHTYSLAECAKRWLDLDLAKGADTWRLRYGELIETPIPEWPQEATHYALADAAVTAAVWEAQRQWSHVLEDEPAQCRADWFLHLTSTHGIVTDPHAVEKFARDLEHEASQIRSQLVDGGFMRADGSRNVKAVQEYLEYLEQEGAVIDRTDTGKPSTSREALAKHSDPVLTMFGEYGSISKRLSEDLPVLMAGTKRPLHTRFEVLLETSRTSSSKPNIQNRSRKKGARECFVPRDGWVFADADFGKLELFTWATVCQTLLGKSRMAQWLAEGADPHLALAADMLGITLPEASARLADGDPEMANMRNCAKVGNFGFPGGLGVDTFVSYAASGYGVHIERALAERLRAQWFESLPEAREYFAMINELQDSDGRVSLRHLYSNRYRGGCTFTSACNSFFQGLGADIAKAAGYQITRSCYADEQSPLYGSRIVNFVHDQFIVEVLWGSLVDPEIRATHADAAARRLARVMQEAARPFLLPSLHIDVDVKLATCWSKDAKQILDEKGRITPWSPKSSAKPH